MVHMNILADALKSSCKAEKHGKRQAPIHPHPKITIWFPTVMMKHDHISETETTSGHKAGKHCQTQRVWWDQPKVQCNTWKNGSPISYPPATVQTHCPYHVRRNYGSQRDEKITGVLLSLIVCQQ